MSTPSGDAPIEVPPQELIANLAKLYDRFAHALDPYSPERDEAERAFLRELSAWYDSLSKTVVSGISQGRYCPVSKALACER